MFNAIKNFFSKTNCVAGEWYPIVAVLPVKIYSVQTNGTYHVRYVWFKRLEFRISIAETKGPLKSSVTMPPRLEYRTVK